MLYDRFGAAFNLAAVIANASMPPIILLESDYIRYKKHGRDVGVSEAQTIPGLMEITYH